MMRSTLSVCLSASFGLAGVAANLAGAESVVPLVLRADIHSGNDPLRRVWVVFDAKNSMGQSQGQLQAALTADGKPIPCLTEFPLPWPDNQVAACVSWKAADAPVKVGSLSLSFSPGRCKPVQGVAPANLWPDPYVDRPAHYGEAKNITPNEWWYNGTKAEVLEKTPGAGKALRLENAQAGNWYGSLNQPHHLKIEPGRSYIFSVRYTADRELSGLLQAYYRNAKTGKEMEYYECSAKPRVYWRTDRWRMLAMPFTPPPEAATAWLCVKFTDAGVLWVKDFALVPVYEPAIRLIPLAEEYPLSARVARFELALLTGRDALIPVAESPPLGVQAWTVKRLADDAGIKVFVSVGAEPGEREVARGDKRIVEAPLPGKAGIFEARFRFAGADGNVIATEKQSVRVRGPNALDFN
jgi:hypothetical protein